MDTSLHTHRYKAPAVRSWLGPTAGAVCVVVAFGCGRRNDAQALRQEVAKLQKRVHELERLAANQKAHLAGLEEAYAKLSKRPVVIAEPVDPLLDLPAEPAAAPAQQAQPAAAGANDDLAAGLLALAEAQGRAMAAMADQWEDVNAVIATLVGDDPPQEVRTLLTRLAQQTAQRMRELAQQRQALAQTLRGLGE